MADLKDEFEAWWPVGRERWISESASVNEFVEWAFAAGWQQRDDQLRRAALSPDSDNQTRAMRFLPSPAPVMPPPPARPGLSWDWQAPMWQQPGPVVPPDNADYAWTTAGEAPEHMETVYDGRYGAPGPVPTPLSVQEDDNGSS